MKCCRFTFALAGLAPIFLFTAHAQINIVQNGSFELGEANRSPIDWGYTYNVGLWIGFSNAADGSDWAEVDGTLYQNLATIPGQTYNLVFALAGNYNITSQTEIDTRWGNTDLGLTAWNPAGHNINNLGWAWADYQVTATSDNTRLTFANPYQGDGTLRDPFLDAVSVTAVPEPASGALICLGLIGIAGRPRSAARR